MPVWRLHPCDPLDPNWEASSHRGPVIVRAHNETAAREIAQRAFGVKTRFGLSKGVLAPPWLRPQLVRAQIVESPAWPAEGPEEVLEPSFGQDLPRAAR